jgi:hypothetical protein
MLHYNYLLFDAAKAEMNLYTAMELNGNFQSLYKGSADEDLVGVAPYLFSIKENTPFADWYFKEGWNQSWGTLVFANAAFEDVYKHFRKFLMIKTEEGEQLYFRFYDPRVLRIFLPTCDAQQLREFFGPVRHFLTESENTEETLEFWLEGINLKTKTISINPAKTIKIQTTDNTTKNIDVKQEAIAEVVQTTQPESDSKDKPKKKWDFLLE